jgi:CDP-glucose 4,6-dehydratase
MADGRRSLENMVIMDLKSHFAGKKVFVTGHTGFKGSWLVAWLNLLGAQVKGYALAPENEYDLYNAIGGDTLCQSVIADIRDEDRLCRELVSFQPDFLFHLAAQPLVRRSYERPDYTFEVNAQGTANVLEAIRQLEKHCVAVMITTDKVYENLETGHYYKETDRLGGYDPYSASKACAELIIDSYRKSFFNPADYESHKKSISVARAGNVIGGGDWAKDRIIPDIIRSLVAEVPVFLRSPTSVRPWQHVMEPLFGYLLLASYQFSDPFSFSTAYNFGPEPSDILAVEEITREALDIWGTGTYEKQLNLLQPHEAVTLRLDISKAKAQLKWVPRFNARTAVRETVEWYRQNLSTGKARELVFQQINAYCTLV